MPSAAGNGDTLSVWLIYANYGSLFLLTYSKWRKAVSCAGAINTTPKQVSSNVKSYFVFLTIDGNVKANWCLLLLHFIKCISTEISVWNSSEASGGWSTLIIYLSQSVKNKNTLLAEVHRHNTYVIIFEVYLWVADPQDSYAPLNSHLIYPPTLRIFLPSASVILLLPSMPTVSFPHAPPAPKFSAPCFG